MEQFLEEVSRAHHLALDLRPFHTLAAAQKEVLGDH